MGQTEAASGAAPARTALAGNPSDGYGGAVLSVTLQEFGARATVTRAPVLRVTPPNTLVDAAAHRFVRDIEPAAACSAIEWTTSIPASVGLGGSTAIVIATARALGALHDVDLAPRALVDFALSVEREDLGIAGGRQDQVTLAYGGLTLMDFGADPGGQVEQLDPALLPPLVVAWRSDSSESSGAVHGDLRRRYASGAMPELAELAHQAAAALRDADIDRFARCVDASFDHRARLLDLDPRHVAMIERARSCGAAANYTGSGGAIVAVCRDEAHRVTTQAELGQLGCGVLLPTEAEHS